MRVLEFTPKRMSGALVFKGTRIPMHIVLYMLSQKRHMSTITERYYPHLNIDMIFEALEDVANLISTNQFKKWLNRDIKSLGKLAEEYNVPYSLVHELERRVREEQSKAEVME